MYGTLYLLSCIFWRKYRSYHKASTAQNSSWKEFTSTLTLPTMVPSFSGSCLCWPSKTPGEELKVACDVKVRSRNRNPAARTFLSCHSHPFPPSYSKTSPQNAFSSFFIFALAKDCNNDETEKHDGDGTTHEEDGRRQRHDMRRRPQVRELVALRREGGRRGGKSLFSPFLFALYYGIAHRAHPSHPFHIRPSTPPRMYAHPSHRILSPYVLLSATAYLELLLRLRCCHGSRNL